MHDQNQVDRLDRIERKVDWTLRLVTAHLILSCVIGLGALASRVFHTAVALFVPLLILVPLLYIFRERLPGFLRASVAKVGRWLATSVKRVNVSRRTDA